MTRVLAGYPLRPAPTFMTETLIPSQDSADNAATMNTSYTLASTQHASSTRCFLLELPAELRNRIYELFLTVEPDAKGCVYLGKRPTQGTDRNHSMRVQRWQPAEDRYNCAKGKWVEETIDFIPTRLCLLQTCKQINSEACALFYNLNHIAIDAQGFERGPRSAIILPPGRQFLCNTSKLRLSGVTHLTVFIRILEDVCHFCKHAVVLVNLRRLTIIVPGYSMDISTDDAFARNESLIEKALRQLPEGVLIKWVTEAEGKQPQLDGFVDALEARKHRINEAKQKGSKKQGQASN